MRAAERNNKQNTEKKENKTILKHYNYTALSAIYYLFIYDFARALKASVLKFEVKDDSKKSTANKSIARKKCKAKQTMES